MEETSRVSESGAAGQPHHNVSNVDSLYKFAQGRGLTLSQDEFHSRMDDPARAEKFLDNLIAKNAIKASDKAAFMSKIYEGVEPGAEPEPVVPANPANVPTFKMDNGLNPTGRERDEVARRMFDPAGRVPSGGVAKHEYLQDESQKRLAAMLEKQAEYYSAVDEMEQRYKRKDDGSGDKAVDPVTGRSLGGGIGTDRLAAQREAASRLGDGVDKERERYEREVVAPIRKEAKAALRDYYDVQRDELYLYVRAAEEKTNANLRKHGEKERGRMLPYNEDKEHDPDFQRQVRELAREMSYEDADGVLDNRSFYKRTYENYAKGVKLNDIDEDRGVMPRFWEGMKMSFNKGKEVYTLGIHGLTEAVQLRNAMGRMEDGTASEADRRLVRSAYDKGIAEGLFDGGTAFDVGSGTWQSMEFMLDMAVTGLIGRGVRGVAKGVTRGATAAVSQGVGTGGGFGQTMKKSLSSFGDQAIGAAVSPMTGRGAAERQMGNYSKGYDENGNLAVERYENAESVAASLLRSYAGGLVERGTETLVGPMFDYGAKAVSGVLSRPLAGLVENKNWFKTATAWLNNTDNFVARSVKNFKERAALDGYPGEVFEEFVGEPVSRMIKPTAAELAQMEASGEGRWDGLYGAEWWKQVLLTCGVIQVGMATPGLAANGTFSAANALAMRKHIQRLPEDMGKALQKAAMIKDEAQRNQRIAEVMRGATDEQLKEAVYYLTARNARDFGVAYSMASRMNDGVERIYSTLAPHVDASGRVQIAADRQTGQRYVLSRAASESDDYRVAYPITTMEDGMVVLGKPEQAGTNRFDMGNSEFRSVDAFVEDYMRIGQGQAQAEASAVDAADGLASEPSVRRSDTFVADREFVYTDERGKTQAVSVGSTIVPLSDVPEGAAPNTPVSVVVTKKGGSVSKPGTIMLGELQGKIESGEVTRRALTGEERSRMQADDGSNDVATEETGGDGATPASEAQAETAQDAVEAEGAGTSIPQDEKGRTQYEQVPVEDTVRSIYDGSGLTAEQADAFVGKKLSAARAEAEKVAKKEPRIDTFDEINLFMNAQEAWRKQMDDAERKAAYWQQVKETRDVVRETPADIQPGVVGSKTEQATSEPRVAENATVVDNQGNPVDVNGVLVADEISDISELSDEDFDEPTRSVILPKVPENIDKALGANHRPVVIKKSIFEKNGEAHLELSPAESREILKEALYSPDLIGNNQPLARPNYQVAIHLGDKNSVVVLDVFDRKDNVEIVGWRKIDEKGLERMKRRAQKEGGQFLILSSQSDSAAALSDVQSNPSLGSKDTTSPEENQAENPIRAQYEALLADNEGNEAEALDTARQMVSNTQSELDKARKAATKGKTVETIQDAKRAKREKIAALEKDLKFWQDVAGYPAARRKAAEAEELHAIGERSLHEPDVEQDMLDEAAAAFVRSVREEQEATAERPEDADIAAAPRFAGEMFGEDATERPEERPASGNAEANQPDIEEQVKAYSSRLDSKFRKDKDGKVWFNGRQIVPNERGERVMSHVEGLIGKTFEWDTHMHIIRNKILGITPKGDVAYLQTDYNYDGSIDVPSRIAVMPASTFAEYGIQDFLEVNPGASRLATEEDFPFGMPHNDESVPFHKGGKRTPGSRRVYELTRDLLRKAGIKVHEVSAEQARAMANFGQRMSASKKRALDTAVGSLRNGQATVVSSADGAKIAKNLDELSKEYQDKKKSKTFLGDLSRALGLRNNGNQSSYGDFECANGVNVRIRVSDHNATAKNFDDAGVENGISIVVTRRNNQGITDNGDAHIVEYYYNAIQLERVDGKPLSDIVRSVQQMLYSGEFVDATGLAERQEVNGADVQFLQTPQGEVYGWTVGGEVYLNKDAMNPETPLHEYTHLWDDMVRRSNPDLWARGVALMKRTPLWSEVMDDPNYADIAGDEDAVASEVHSRLTGADGAALLERMASGEGSASPFAGSLFEADGTPRSEAAGLVSQIKAWLGEVFEALKSTLSKLTGKDLEGLTQEQFVRMPLRDLLDGVNPTAEVAVEDEASEIERKAKADGTWLKAPNGKPTKLTPKQWLQVRTKAFKDWFGEWEKSARIEKLRGSKPVEITGDEITPSDDMKTYKRNALEYGKTLRGEYVNGDTGETVIVNRQAIKEVLEHDYKNVEQLQSVAAIPAIIENGIYITTLTNEDTSKNKDVKEYAYYVCGLKIGGEDYTVKSVVAIDRNGNRYYDHKLTQIEKGDLLNELARITSPASQEVNPLSGVKDKRLLSILQVDASKVVDENGEPLVVYHGTDAAFNTFESDFFGQNTDFNATDESYAKTAHIGFWFNHGGNLELAYPSKRMPCFIRARNPYHFDNLESLANWLNEESVEGLRNYLEENGHDGITLDTDEEFGGRSYVAFSPNQIKSATDNVGTFDAGNDDIRYSRNWYGGNSGYVGYSMSRRAAEAREDGRFPKTDFKKEYGITDKALEALTKLGFINDSEWHHTSKYGNKTTFYGWNEDSHEAGYRQNKREIDKLAREYVAYKEQALGNELLPFLSEFDMSNPNMERIGLNLETYLQYSVLKLDELTKEEKNVFRERHAEVSQSGLPIEERRVRHKEIEEEESALRRERYPEIRRQVRESDEYREAMEDIHKRVETYNKAKERLDAIASIMKMEEETEKPSLRFRFAGELFAEDGAPEDADIRFHIEKPVEQKGELVAVHNLSEDKLKEALGLGGFPMPSIAITKGDIGHTGFGDISLVFGKESIDPTDSRNKVYGEDAWTPTFPQVGYKANDAVTEQLSRKYYDLERKYGREVVDALYPWGNYAADELNRIGGEAEIFARYQDDTYMMKVYMADKGLDIPKPIIKEIRTRLPEGKIALYDYLIDKLGKDVINETNSNGRPPKEVRQEWNIAHGKKLEQVYRNFLAEKGFTEEQIENVLANTGPLIHLAVGARRYMNNGPETVKTETDITATHQAIRDAVDNDGYHAWLHGLFDGIEEKRGIRNDKDMFTPIGNRRRFESLYDEITLDNVVKAMQRQSAKGGEGIFNSSIFGAAQKEFKSIEQIRKAARERIRQMDYAEHEKGKNAITDRLSEIKFPGMERKATYIFDWIGNVKDAVAKSHTPQGIYNYLKGFYPGMTMDAANEIADVVKDIQKMSARYFEAKPRRAVGIREVKFAVVPEGTSAETIKRLERYGIPVKTYEKGNQTQRVQLVNEEAAKAGTRFRFAGEMFDTEGGSERKADSDATSHEAKRSAAESLASRLGVPVETEDDRPGRPRRGLQSESQGWYDPKTGTVHVNLGNHADAEDVKRTVLHEAVGHLGMRRLFDRKKPGAFDTFLDRVYASMGAEARSYFESYARKSMDGMSVGEEALRRMAADEYVAALAEVGGEVNVWQRVVAEVRSLLRAMGLDVRLSDADIRALLYESRHNLESAAYYAERELMRREQGIFRAEARLARRVEEDEADDAATDDNARFNEQLASLTAENADDVILSLGSPSEVLLAAGVSDKPMRLYGNKVMAKIKKHGYPLSALRDLPRAVAEPIAVFKGSTANSHVVLTELRTKQGNIVVSLEVGKGGADVDFNVITSAYGKNDANVVNWINKGLATYIDKQKALDYISVPAPIAGAQYSQGLSDATKVIESFENPKPLSETPLLYRRRTGTMDDSRLGVISLDSSDGLRYDSEYGRWTRQHFRKMATGWERFFLDDAMPVRHLMTHLRRAAGGVVSSATDLWQLMATVPSKIQYRIEEYERRIGKPLAKTARAIYRGTKDAIGKYFDPAMSDNALYLMELYLQSKHIPERNALMNARKGTLAVDYAGATRFEAKTGMTPEAYAKQYEKMLSDLKLDGEMQEIWRLINESTSEALRLRLDYGLLSKESYDAITGMGYQYYVPLKGYDEKNANSTDYMSIEYPSLADAYQPSRVAKIHKADGRRSLADDPMPYILNDVENVIRAGEANRFRQALAKLRDDNNTKTYIFGTAADKKEILLRNKNPLSEFGNEIDSHFVSYYENGEKKSVYMVNPKLAAALRGDVERKAGGFWNHLNLLRGWTRFMAAMNTAMNPVFAITNMIRDVSFAMLSRMVEADNVVEYALGGVMFFAEWLRYMPVAVQASLPNGHVGDGKAAAMIRAWRENGGETGWHTILSLRETKDKLYKEVTRSKAGNATRAVVKALPVAFRFLTEMSENSVRLAAFADAKRRGKDDQAAAYYAKEVTTNFNRRSQLSLFVGPVFAFFNAQTQGIYRFLTLAKENPASMALTGAGLLAAGVLNGLVQGLNGGDDDDEGGADYFARNLFTRTTNLVLGNATIPLPHSFRLFTGVGVALADYMAGRCDEEELHINVTAIIGRELLPGFANVTDYAEYDPKRRSSVRNWTSALVGITPTPLVPFMEIYNNRNYMGGEIHREATYDEYAPRVARYRKGTNPHLVRLTEKIAALDGYDPEIDYATGYNAERHAMIRQERDVNASDVEHVLESILGGTGQFVNDIAKVIAKTKNGEDLDASDIPVLKRLYRVTDEDVAINRKYREIDEVAKYWLDAVEKYEKGIENPFISDYARGKAVGKYVQLSEDIAYGGLHYFDKLGDALRMLDRKRNEGVPDEELKEIRTDIMELANEIEKEFIGRYNAGQAERARAFDDARSRNRRAVDALWDAALLVGKQREAAGER